MKYLIMMALSAVSFARDVPQMFRAEDETGVLDVARSEKTCYYRLSLAGVKEVEYGECMLINQDSLLLMFPKNLDKKPSVYPAGNLHKVYEL